MRLPAAARFRPVLYYAGLLLVATLCGWHLLTEDEPPSSFAERLAEYEAAGRKIPVRWHMHLGLWWATWLNLGLALVLLVLGPWLTRPRPQAHDSEAGSASPPRFVWAVVLAAIAWAAWIQGPRLGHSLWGDESFNLRKSAIGEFRASGGEPLRYHPRKTHDAWFSYDKPNNDVPNTLLARLVHGAADTDPEREDGYFFEEWKLRLPAFLAALGSIAAIGLLLVRAGLPTAVAVALPLLVLHPWFVRYGSEFRGYAFLLLLVPSILLAYGRAERTGSWPAWLLLGLLEFLLFWTYPASVYFLVVLNAAAVWLFVRDRDLARAKRWFVASTLAAMAAVQVTAPLLPQLKVYLARLKDRSDGGSPMGVDWILDEVAYLTSGMPWRPWDAGNPLCLSWTGSAQDRAGLLPATGLIAVGVLLVIGAVYVGRKGRLARVVLACSLLPPALAYLHNHIASNYLYPWYLLFALPGVVVLAACGAMALGELLAGRTRDRRIVLLPGLVLVVGFLFLTSAQRDLLRTRSSEPTREAVETYREITNPFHPDTANVVSAAFHMKPQAYDPLARVIGTADDLRALIAETRESQRPLFVHFAQYGMAREHFPDIVALLEDETQFAEHALLHGLSEQCTRHVYRYVGTE